MTFTTSSTLQCKRCQNPIKFDDRHISQKTGKKIPLDAQTGQRHDCPALPAQQRPPSQQQPTERGKRFLKCSKGCGGEIYFDVNTKTKKGKRIPISKITGL